MSTSRKTRASIRQGGPGASHENAKAPLHIEKPPAQSDLRRHSGISGGGGERDLHHTHDPEQKGGGTRPARARPTFRVTDAPVKSGGLHQESDHNKHNDPGQSGHKPQKHSADEQEN